MSWLASTDATARACARPVTDSRNPGSRPYRMPRGLCTSPCREHVHDGAGLCVVGMIGSVTLRFLGSATGVAGGCRRQGCRPRGGRTVGAGRPRRRPSRRAGRASAMRSNASVVEGRRRRTTPRTRSAAAYTPRRAARGRTRGSARSGRPWRRRSRSPGRSAKNTLTMLPANCTCARRLGASAPRPTACRGVARCARVRRTRPASAARRLARPGGDGDGVPGQGARLVHGPGGGEMAHDVGAATERGGGQTAAHHLAEGVEVTGDAVEAEPAGGLTRNPVITSSMMSSAPLSAGQLAQALVESGLRRDRAHVAGGGLGDDARDLARVRGEGGGDGVEVVVGQRRWCRPACAPVTPGDVGQAESRERRSRRRRAARRRGRGSSRRT